MTPLRVLMIGDVLPWHPMAGGAAVTPFSLAKALATAGHQVDYVALAPENFQRKVDWGNITYVASTNRYVSPFLQYLKTRGRLRDYDIVHAHGIEGLGFAIHRQLFRDIRLVNGFYLGTVNKFPWNIRSPFDPYSYFSCKWADMVITNSQHATSQICDAYRIETSSVRVMYIGADESFLRDNASQRSTDGCSLLFCGYLGGPRQVKGVDVLLDAMPTILGKHEATLDIIGTGEHVDKYKAMCGDLGIRDSVRFVGFVDHSDLPAYFASANMFVLPSRSESMPVVVAEAMASALPVVSTTVGGISELVDQGETGVLVPPNDPHALAEAVVDMLNDPERMRDMGTRGRERVRQHFTWDKVAERVVEFYQEIL